MIPGWMGLGGARELGASNCSSLQPGSQASGPAPVTRHHKKKLFSENIHKTLFYVSSGLAKQFLCFLSLYFPFLPP